MVYLFLADGFEEIEALTPLDMLRRAKVNVKTVGVTGKSVAGSHNITVNADISAADAQTLLDAGRDNTEMIILPGGMPGANNLNNSSVVDAYIRKSAASDAYLAAICAAPMILGVRGLLKGKNATCFPGFEKYLNGAVLSDKPSVIDGKVITACGIGAAFEFALDIVKVLKGDNTAADLASAVMYKR